MNKKFVYQVGNNKKGILNSGPEVQYVPTQPEDKHE
jgi:hypothetical protein